MRPSSGKADVPSKTGPRLEHLPPVTPRSSLERTFKSGPQVEETVRLKRLDAGEAEVVSGGIRGLLPDAHRRAAGSTSGAVCR